MNHIESIRANFKGIIGTTLREGEQFAGGKIDSDGDDLSVGKFEFSIEQATNILRAYNLIGVEKAEVPNAVIPGMDAYIRQLSKLSNRPALISHIRNNQKDVFAAIDAGVDEISILTTVDERRIEKMGLTYASYFEQLIGVVRTAQEHGLGTRISVEHTWNSDFDKALEVYALAETLGVDRIGLADTIGIATHWEVAEKITAVRERVKKIPIEVHFHNDCLSAVANSIEALASGANWIDTTFAGIGERTGITPLSAFLVRLYTIDPTIVERYNLESLTLAEQYVAELAGVPLPFNIITAPNAFIHKAGIHLDGLLKIGPQLYEALDPSLVGNTRGFMCESRISGKTTKQDMHKLHNGNGAVEAHI